MFNHLNSISKAKLEIGRLAVKGKNAKMQVWCQSKKNVKTNKKN
jgi:hypothetical protein